MTQQVNLLQGEFSNVALPFFAETLVPALGAILALLLLIYGYSLWQTLAPERRLTSLEASKKSQATLLEELQKRKAGRKPDPALAAEVFALDHTVGGKNRLLEALTSHGLANREGFSEHLLGLARQRVDGVWLKRIQITAGGRSMALAGKALSPEAVPKFIEELAPEPAYVGREFQTLLLWNAALMEPLEARRLEADNRIASLELEIQQLEQQTEKLASELSIDLDVENRARKENLLSSLDHLRGVVDTRTDDLIPPVEMTRVLKQMLIKTVGLRLVRLENLPVEPLFETPEELGVEIEGGGPLQARGRHRGPRRLSHYGALPARDRAASAPFLLGEPRLRGARVSHRARHAHAPVVEHAGRRGRCLSRCCGSPKCSSSAWPVGSRSAPPFPRWRSSAIRHGPPASRVPRARPRRSLVEARASPPRQTG